MNSNSQPMFSYPFQNSMNPSCSTFPISRLERTYSTPMIPKSPFQKSNKVINSPMKNQSPLVINETDPIFDMNINNFHNFQPSNNDLSSFFGGQDPNSQLLLQNLKTDTNAFMEMEGLDFSLGGFKQTPAENETYNLSSMPNMIQAISMPPPKAKIQVKAAMKEKYAYPKKKNTNANRKWKDNDRFHHGKHTTGGALEESPVIMPAAFTHFTRSNSDVPPTLESNLGSGGPKENCLGDNKYLNNLKDKKGASKSSMKSNDMSHFSAERNTSSNSFQEKKDTPPGGGKSKFAKNLFADFNDDSDEKGGLFEIQEKPIEYDFMSQLRSGSKMSNNGEFDLTNTNAISKFLEFGSEGSDGHMIEEENPIITIRSPFDNEEPFMLDKDEEEFSTPAKKVKMMGLSEKFHLFSNLTPTKGTKSIFGADFMNSTNVTDFSTGDIASQQKRGVTTSYRKEQKEKKVQSHSRFENDYEILETLGSGNFGVVYKCQNKLDGLIYAIKCTHNKFKGESHNNQVLKEAQALASLSALDENPFIVRYYNTWVEDDRLYLVMEHCQSNLRKLKNEHMRFSESNIRQIMRDICMGLKHLHSQKIVHLDIKPENILYSKTKKYKIGDLGLSKIALCSNNREITEGDTRYLAPEICNNFMNTQLDDLTKADIFSFGATIYELMTGTEFSKNGQEWLNIRRGNFHKIDHLSYSNSLKSIIKSMLSSNPDYRPSADELLTTFLQSEVDLELKWEKKQNRALKKQIREMEDQLGIRRKNSM